MRYRVLDWPLLLCTGSRLVGERREGAISGRVESGEWREQEEYREKGQTNSGDRYHADGQGALVDV